MKPGRPRWRAWAGAFLAMLALALVRGLYDRPEMAFDLAARLWSCL